MTRLRWIALAACLCLPVTASAQSGAGDDARYCGELIKLYRSYIYDAQNPRSTRSMPIAAHEIAIGKCQSGHPAEGIPVLEKALRDNGFSLPSRG
jgi:hypothetical protein